MPFQSSFALAFLGILSWVSVAGAQVGGGVVGSIATMEGTVEIHRDSAWQAAVVGSEVETGDEIRTGTPGRARLVFHDDSVITVGDGSLFKIEMTVEPPSAGPLHFVLDLVVGKVRALVSEYYQEPLASYQIETATAVSAVRGTEFVVEYNAASKTTEVLGLGGTVSVHSTIDKKNHGVNITRLMLTRVTKGKFPTPPQMIQVDDDSYRRLLSGVDFVAGGQPESLSHQAGTPDVAPEKGGVAEQPRLDVAPPVELTPDPASRTPSQITDQPSAPVGGSGGAKVDF